MTTAQEITRAFNGEWRGNQGFIPTPGHSAKDRGTTVRDTENGDVVFHSFNAGPDDWKQIKDQCRNKGLLPERQRQQSSRAALQTSGTNCPTKEGFARQAGKSFYEFQDADGVTICRKVRTDKPDGSKFFTWQHPDGKGGWASGRGCDALPYRLPDLLAAPADAVIYVAEGERKADKLAGWGLVATSSKDLPADLSVFAGRTVAILPDNDDQGAKIADDLLTALNGVAERAFLVDLPGLPPKGDIIDWTGTVDDLQALVERLSSPPVETFPLADLALWSNIRPTPKAFVMAGFVPARELTLATGAGGANKSTFGQQLATCRAAGVPMLGVEVQQGKALYITAEDDDNQLHWMQDHICRTLGVHMEDLVGRLALTSLRGRLGNELATFDHEGKLRPAPSFRVLRATIEATGADLVVLDNAAHLFAGNENDRQQVTAFVNLLYSLCQDLGVTIILVAHANKAGDTYSGSTAWLNAVRSQIVLSRPENTIDPDERLLSLGKANYARQGEELRFRWHDFALVRDSDLPEDMRVQLAAAAATAGANAAFLECLRARNDQGDGRQVGPSSGPNYAPSQFEGMPQAKGFKKEALKRAMDRLYALGRIKSETVFDRKAKRDKTVIVEAGEPSHNAHNARTTPPQHTPTRPHNDGTTGGQHTPIYKYIPGAANGAAAPSHEREDALDLSRLNFASDEDGDLDANGDIHGWNDGARP